MTETENEAEHLMQCMREAFEKKRLESLLDAGEWLYILDSEDCSEEVQVKIWEHFMGYYLKGLVIQENIVLSKGGAWTRIPHIKELERISDAFGAGEIEYPDLPYQVIEELTNG